MTRRTRLRQICKETCPKYRSVPEEELNLLAFLRIAAIELFLQGVAFWQDEDAGAIREALKEYYETGQISEYEHTRTSVAED